MQQRQLKESRSDADKQREQCTRLDEQLANANEYIATLKQEVSLPIAPVIYCRMSEWWFV